MPAADADHLRDLLIAHGAHTVIEIGLGYGSSVLAIGEALWPSVATALRYFDLNLGWQPVTIAGRLTAR